MEQETTLRSIAFWREQPEALTVSDGQGGEYDFREKHLVMLERDLANIEAAIHVLEPVKS